MTFYSHDKSCTRLGELKGDNSHFEKIHRRLAKTFLDVLVKSNIVRRLLKASQSTAHVKKALSPLEVSICEECGKLIAQPKELIKSLYTYLAVDER